MKISVIKKGIMGLLLVLPLSGVAETKDPDLFAGYTTQDLTAALPARLLNMVQRDKVVDVPNHMVQTEYVDPTTGNKALVSLFMLPPDKDGNVPIASAPSDLDAVIASTEKEMLRQRIKPDQRAGKIDDATPFRCLQTILNNKVLHSLCSTLIKGRVLEVQAINTIANIQDEAELYKVIGQQNEFVIEMGKTLLALKK
ncbi:hypothetical protein [Pectobacterium wasabiae]|uniref:Uncharacterized protein n=1 Tax=Pectobacterium wasabiae TaxID=55208 RepID=A0AAW3EBG1_9GAMM|nr:hypothetical protein [Pectobacterium wasabiae]AOR65444.1 hypothetical protein A7983_19705 [Pectobacterium wasabiae CFBP 3304]EJS93282.1 Hypothetical protein Y17_3543 [Pectobacterium wasabiae CFBP 3304]KFX02536.1 hypothetical protein JV38_21680 [Pectobacterium wasabiae]KGA26485.1 hypothetical protein KU73_21050 [Pectobacterium wasabiae]